MKRAMIVYWSKTGNTEKVAFAIKEGLEAAGMEVSILTTQNAANVDFYEYNLVSVGCPSYFWHPPKPVDDFLRSKFTHYRSRGRVTLGAPKVPGRNALVFCTYSGPHTGINEAIPVGKYMGQFFEHLGFTVVGEWYVLGEFHGFEAASTKGKMGDITGRPSEEDLGKVRRDAFEVAERLP